MEVVAHLRFIEQFYGYADCTGHSDSEGMETMKLKSVHILHAYLLHLKLPSAAI